MLRRRKAATTIAVVAMVWLLCCSSTPLPQFLVLRLEQRFPVAGQLPDSSLILVLGAGFTADDRLPFTNQLSEDALARLVEGIRLMRLTPGSKLILSGYAPYGDLSQAETLARAALELGVEPRDTVLLPRPTRTREELENFRKRFPSRNAVVVTSAIHMPRAMAWCAYFGIVALPAPTAHLIKHSPRRGDFDFVPSYRKLMLMHRALHEHLGLLLVPDPHDA